MQFQNYEQIFTPVFLQYNGKTQIITLQYRLRTSKTYVDFDNYLGNLLVQFMKNPIQIPGDLYKIQINDQRSLENLAQNPAYYNKVDQFYIFNLSNLLKLDSEFVNISIDSNFKLNFDSIISSHISIQPKILDKGLVQFEFSCLLKNNLFPERFQCLNIPLYFDFPLNDIVTFFLSRKYLMVANKWYAMETHNSHDRRKKEEYKKMIVQRFGLTPLQFNERINQLLFDISGYVKEHYVDLLSIKNLNGILNPLDPLTLDFFTPKGKSGMLIRFNFETNFDNTHYATHSLVNLNLNWVKKFIKDYFK